MIILFQIGSTTLFELGLEARQDAWLVILLGCFLGSLLLAMFVAIQAREMESNLFRIFLRYFGPWAGRAAIVLYVVFFAYESMRNLRDFGDLTNLTVLPRTPLPLILLVLTLLVAYAALKGIEVFFRLAEFIVIGVISFYAVLIAFYLLSGIVAFERLLPILENGASPVLKEVFRDALWFPFGQMFVFLVFWSYLQKSEGRAVWRISVRAYFVSAAVIWTMNVLALCTLGPDFIEISTIPLLQSTQLIQLAEIFERFDALVFLLFYAGIFVKATVWLLAAVIGLEELFRKSYRWFVVPTAGALYAASLLPRSWQGHLETGKLVAERYMATPIMLGAFPAMLLVVMVVRGWIERGRRRNAEEA